MGGMWEVQSESVDLLNEAKEAFYEDRYEDTENLLIQARKELEFEKYESTRLSTIRKNAKNFIQRN